MNVNKTFTTSMHRSLMICFCMINQFTSFPLTILQNAINRYAQLVEIATEVGSKNHHHGQ